MITSPVEKQTCAMRHGIGYFNSNLLGDDQIDTNLKLLGRDRASLKRFRIFDDAGDHFFNIG